MTFIHIGQKRHTVSELVNRYKKSKSKDTSEKIYKTAEMYLSAEDFNSFYKKIK